MGVYRGLDADDVRARTAALERFARWEEQHPARVGPEVALGGVAALYELLPLESRSRPVDASGVRAMHAALSVLGGS